MEKPVILPPGLARLATRPARTGSPAHHHDDRNSGRGILGRDGGSRASVPMISTLSRTSSSAYGSEQLGLTASVAVFDDQVMALDPAKRAHGCPELLNLGGSSADIGLQDAYAADVCRGLRARTERPAENERAAEHCESAATMHGLTSPPKGCNHTTHSRRFHPDRQRPLLAVERFATYRDKNEKSASRAKAALNPEAIEE